MPFRLRLHIHLENGHSLGPGKIALLEAIDAEGSISAGAREMGMAYRHAWELVDDLNRCFRGGVVVAGTGGARGGGARLTPLGRDLVTRFHAVERAANAAIARELAPLEGASVPRARKRDERKSRAPGAKRRPT